MDVITRRTALRGLLLAGVGGPLLAACGDHGDMSSASKDPGLGLVAAHVARGAGNDAAVPAVVAALAGFTTRLWPRLSDPGQAGANLAISPYSIATALAMAANGARGTTQQQMRDVLGIDELSSYNDGLAALTQRLEGLAGAVTLPDGTHDRIALASADQLFGDRSATWDQDFLDVLARAYGAGMRTVDFRQDADGARRLVNAWVSDQTHGRIPDLLPPGSLDAMTRLVLANALYFKAPWATPFDPQLTRSAPFHRADGSTVDVDMMVSGSDGGTYVTGPHYEGGRLLYAGGTLAMTVALPEQGHEAEALDALLGHGLTAPGERGLQLSLPRFTFRTPTALSAVLSQLGMPLAFASDADFSGMTDTEPLQVSDVFHEAFVAVDEHGTEAAAATAVGMRATSVSVDQHVLVCDRPFLFVLHDTEHGTPLFVGRVADPS